MLNCHKNTALYSVFARLFPHEPGVSPAAESYLPLAYSFISICSSLAVLHLLSVHPTSSFALPLPVYLSFCCISFVCLFLPLCGIFFICITLYSTSFACFVYLAVLTTPIQAGNNPPERRSPRTRLCGTQLTSTTGGETVCSFLLSAKTRKKTICLRAADPHLAAASRRKPPNEVFTTLPPRIPRLLDEPVR